VNGTAVSQINPYQIPDCRAGNRSTGECICRKTNQEPHETLNTCVFGETCDEQTGFCGITCDATWRSPNEMTCKIASDNGYCRIDQSFGFGWNYRMSGEFAKIVNHELENAFVCPECGCEECVNSVQDKLQCVDYCVAKPNKYFGYFITKQHEFSCHTCRCEDCPIVTECNCVGGEIVENHQLPGCKMCTCPEIAELPTYEAHLNEQRFANEFADGSERLVAPMATRS
jgi:hypothetical protein